MRELTVVFSLLFSVGLGGFLVTYLNQTNKSQIIKLLLAFSGGFLLSIAFTHLFRSFTESTLQQSAFSS